MRVNLTMEASRNSLLLYHRLQNEFGMFFINKRKRFVPFRYFYLVLLYGSLFLFMSSIFITLIGFNASFFHKVIAEVFRVQSLTPSFTSYDDV